MEETGAINRCARSGVVASPNQFELFHSDVKPVFPEQPTGRSEPFTAVMMEMLTKIFLYILQCVIISTLCSIGCALKSVVLNIASYISISLFLFCFVYSLQSPLLG